MQLIDSVHLLDRRYYYLLAHYFLSLFTRFIFNLSYKKPFLHLKKLPADKIYSIKRQPIGRLFVSNANQFK